MSAKKSAHPGKPPGPRARLTPYVLALLLATLTAAVFAPVRHFEFVSWDDTGYVTTNEVVKQGLTPSGLAWAFTNPGHFYWHPLTWLSHMADVEFLGLDAGAHHLTNLVLHIIATLLLFFVLRRMTGHLYRSAMAAALFAIHPLRVESVAWIAERKDVLSGVFLMLTLWAYAAYTRRRSAARYALVVGAFALGLMAKPTLVTLPLALLLLDAWPLGRAGLGARCLVIEKLPLFALSLVASVATFVSQLEVEAVATISTVPVAERLANAAASTVGYLGTAVWPHGLAAFYPFRPIPTWWAACCALVLAAVSVGVLVVRVSRPYLAVGWFWYLVMLLPVIGLVQAGSQSMADRFTYLPLTGLLVAGTWAVDELVSRLPARRWIAAACAAAVVAPLAVAARTQVGFWRDSETMWRRATEAVPNNDLAHANLGLVLSDAGREDEALEHLTEAIRIVSDHNPASGTGRGTPPAAYAFLLHNSRGLLLARMQQFPEAVADLQEAVRLRPASPDAYYALGMALASGGRPAEGAEETRQAIRLDPARPAFRADLAGVLFRQGDLAGAIGELREALRIAPSHASAARWHYNLAAMLNAGGQPDDAVRELRQALRIDPGYVAASRALNGMLNGVK